MQLDKYSKHGEEGTGETCIHDLSKLNAFAVLYMYVTYITHQCMQLHVLLMARNIYCIGCEEDIIFRSRVQIAGTLTNAVGHVFKAWKETMAKELRKKIDKEIIKKGIEVTVGSHRIAVSAFQHTLLYRGPFRDNETLVFYLSGLQGHESRPNLLVCMGLHNIFFRKNSSVFSVENLSDFVPDDMNVPDDLGAIGSTHKQRQVEYLVGTQT